MFGDIIFFQNFGLITILFCREREEGREMEGYSCREIEREREREIKKERERERGRERKRERERENELRETEKKRE